MVPIPMSSNDVSRGACSLFVTKLKVGNSLLLSRAILHTAGNQGLRMPYIVVVKHQTKGTSLIPTKIKDAQKAIDQAKIENQEPGYDWQHAKVGYMPDTGTPRKQGRAARL